MEAPQLQSLPVPRQSPPISSPPLLVLSGCVAFAKHHSIRRRAQRKTRLDFPKNSSSRERERTGTDRSRRRLSADVSHRWCTLTVDARHLQQIWQQSTHRTLLLFALEQQQKRVSSVTCVFYLVWSVLSRLQATCQPEAMWMTAFSHSKV